MAQQNKVDGIIGLTYNPDLNINKNTPFVSIDRCMGTGIPCVASDNFAGGQLAAEKLADFGCRNVAFLLHSLGINVPQDVQLIGYDGIRFFGDTDYLCSTIVQPVPDIAELCVKLLLDKTMREKPSLICLPVTYAYGKTTLQDIPK